VRVFLDTNVLAAAMAIRGPSSDVLETVLHDHDLLTCERVLIEVRQVFSYRFHLPPVLTENFLRLVRTEGNVVNSNRSVSLPLRDTNDVTILACAIEGASHVFVTGDRELLQLREVGNVPIASPQQLCEYFAAKARRAG
jgi:putative PIN family toxin of toxin-antitoxin system